jgi:hypothetical protein
MTTYQVVYSAALERSGGCAALSGYTGPSSLAPVALRAPDLRGTSNLLQPKKGERRTASKVRRAPFDSERARRAWHREQKRRALAALKERWTLREP